MVQVRPYRELDGGNHGWLKAKHHFAVTPEGNREHGPLGALVVWNDDEIAPGTGFGLHRHADMEIVSYVRAGAVTHRDSMGNVGRTEAGDVQVISAGRGVMHAEYNLDDEPLRLFQIWLEPRAHGGEPQWGTRRFPRADRANQLVVLASGFAADEPALPIRADARVLGATLLGGARVDYDLRGLRHAYVVPGSGVVEVNGVRLAAGDGLALVDEPSLAMVAHVDSEVVVAVAA
jgi:redox-sensitive bicupin YhaK (pirin superfamily)